MEAKPVSVGLDRVEIQLRSTTTSTQFQTVTVFDVLVEADFVPVNIAL
jgi:hypothetical protein